MGKVNVIPQYYSISRVQREILNGHPAYVLWFTGLSGSGKSTLANAVEQQLYKRKRHTYLLDGDNIRGGLNADLDFSAAGRTENIRRVGEVAALMADAGLVVLTAFVAPFRADRQRVRELIGAKRFVEIFVDCPLEICEQRDVKGLYKRARAGEIPDFTGVSSPFEAPETPDVHVHTNTESLEDSVEKILKHLDNR